MQSAFLKTVHVLSQIVKLSAAGVAEIFNNTRNTVEEKGQRLEHSRSLATSSCA
jgi:hypothetical protein